MKEEKMIDLKELLQQEFGNKVPYESVNQAAIIAARIKATKHHGGQLRNYTEKQEYLGHCQDVVASLEYAYGVTDEAIKAAWLHDTVEDTDYTLSQLQRDFGDTVAQYVWYLTNAPKFVGSRKKRMAIDNDRLIHAPRLVKEIKCADIISNCLNLAELDPEFAETYLREKDELLAEFLESEWAHEKVGHPGGKLTLLPLAIKVVDDGLDRLNAGSKKSSRSSYRSRRR